MCSKSGWPALEVRLPSNTSGCAAELCRSSCDVRAFFASVDIRQMRQRVHPAQFRANTTGARSSRSRHSGYSGLRTAPRCPCRPARRITPAKEMSTPASMTCVETQTTLCPAPGSRRRRSRAASHLRQDCPSVRHAHSGGEVEAFGSLASPWHRAGIAAPPRSFLLQTIRRLSASGPGYSAGESGDAPPAGRASSASRSSVRWKARPQRLVIGYHVRRWHGDGVPGRLRTGLSGGAEDHRGAADLREKAQTPGGTV